MVSRFSRIKAIAAASAMSMALAIASPVAAFAATGTVNGSNINVRSEGSTTSSVVGTVNTGDILTIGDTVTDDSGATWYQVTLDNGTSGYVRADFLTINNDDSTDGDANLSEDGTDLSADGSTEGSTESTDPAVTAATSAAEQDTGGYQVVLAPDTDTGENTYYLYDNNQGVRMKISDIQKLPDEVTAAQQEAANVKTRYRVFLIALAAACAALAVGCILLGIRLRDALANGRRERDLTMERRDQRRNNRNADSVEALRRNGRPAPQGGRPAAGRGRDDAYVSGGRGRDDAYASTTARRVPRDGESGSARDVRNVRTSTTSAVRSERRPVSREDGYAPNRAAESTARESSRPARPLREEDDDVRTARPVRTSAPAGRQTSDRSSDRPSQSAPVRSSRPASNPAPENRSTGAARPASRRTSGRDASDEDFDYDFLQLDDKDDQ